MLVPPLAVSSLKHVISSVEFVNTSGILSPTRPGQNCLTVILNVLHKGDPEDRVTLSILSVIFKIEHLLPLTDKGMMDYLGTFLYFILEKL